MLKVPIDVWRVHVVPYLDGPSIANLSSVSPQLKPLAKDAVLKQLKSKTQRLRELLNTQRFVNGFLMMDVNNYVTDTEGFRYDYNSENVWMIYFYELGGIHRSYIMSDWTY